MNLQMQCCTLEQSKKIAGFGVKRESLFYWVYDVDEWVLMSQRDMSYYTMKPEGDNIISYAAPNVAELGEMLPCDERFGAAWYSGANERGEFYCHIYNDAEEMVFEAETEAQARAEALIWLLDNKYLTAEQLNEVA